MSRRDRNQLNKAFGAQPAPTPHEIDEALYGDFVTLDDGRMHAEPINIFNIQPDLSQPRRTVVSACRHFWDGQPDNIPMLFDAWMKAITSERFTLLPEDLSAADREALSFFDVEAHLEGIDERINREFTPGPFESSFLKVVELAATIRRDGLTNPITVARSGVGHRLETGERRWLAFHLLYAFYTGDDGRPDERDRWQRIPARVVETASVWRMANENNVRADLNAIGKSRQFALLMMDLYRQRGHEFASYGDLVKPGMSDRQFYAQVFDGDKYPIPRGGTEKLLNAMGFTSRSQMSEHRALLNLPDQVWQWADDLNWAQRRIREMIRRAGGDRSTLIEVAMLEAATDGLSVGVPTPDQIADIPNPSPTLPDDGPHKHGKALITRKNKADLRELMAIRSGVGQADIQTKQMILEKIDNAKQWLEQLEKTVAKGQGD